MESRKTSGHELLKLLPGNQPLNPLKSLTGLVRFRVQSQGLLVICKRKRKIVCFFISLCRINQLKDSFDFLRPFQVSVRELVRRVNHQRHAEILQRALGIPLG